ncbi:MAG: hypothetical protein WBR10_11990, partial [Candidatus Acidiferrum sp.]
DQTSKGEQKAGKQFCFFESHNPPTQRTTSELLWIAFVRGTAGRKNERYLQTKLSQVAKTSLEAGPPQ